MCDPGATRPVVAVVHRGVAVLAGAVGDRGVLTAQDVLGQDAVEATEHVLPGGEGRIEGDHGLGRIGRVDRHHVGVAGGVVDVLAGGDLRPGVLEVHRRDRCAVGPDRIGVDLVGHDLTVAGLEGGLTRQQRAGDVLAVDLIVRAGQRVRADGPDAPGGAGARGDEVGALGLLLGGDHEGAVRSGFAAGGLVAGRLAAGGGLLTGGGVLTGVGTVVVVTASGSDQSECGNHREYPPPFCSRTRHALSMPSSCLYVCSNLGSSKRFFPHNDSSSSRFTNGVSARNTNAHFGHLPHHDISFELCVNALLHELNTSR